MILFENWQDITDSYAFGAGVYHAQTFTPAVNHRVEQIGVRLGINDTPVGNFIASIRATAAGLPTGADLTSGVLACNLISFGVFTYYTITLSTAIDLVGGTVYALVLGAPNHPAARIWHQATAAGGYGGGAGCNSADFGVTWAAGAGEDYFFEEWGVLVPATGSTTTCGKMLAISSNIGWGF